MFTGIVTDIGILQEASRLDVGLKLRISSAYDCAKIELGSSMACNGVCLTIVATMPTESCFEVEAWEEAVRLTTIASWQKGESINLERSLKLGDEMGGHLVSGHIDNKAQIIDVKSEGAAKRFYVKAPHELMAFIAKKGSVTLDGVSLTVNSVVDSVFDVLLIDYSLKVTNFGTKNIGDYVNIEIDPIARYCARYTEVQNNYEKK